MSWTLIREHVPSGGFVGDLNGFPTSDGLDTFIAVGTWYEPGSPYGMRCGSVNGLLKLTTLGNLDDVRISSESNVAAGYDEINARYTDETHHYKAVWEVGILVLYVVEPSAGGGAGYAALGTATDPGNFHEVTLECLGDQISVYVDGVLAIGPITDTTFSTGQVCLRGSSSSVFDHLRVYSSGATTPPEYTYDASYALQVGVDVGNIDPTHNSGSVATSASHTGTLPPGLSLDTGSTHPGRITGVPTTVGTYLPEITFTNSGGDGTPADPEFDVAPQPPPTLTYPNSSEVAIIGVTRTIVASISGIGTTVTVSPAFPTGVALNASTGDIVITGTSLVWEYEQVHVLTITDSEMQTAEYNLTFESLYRFTGRLTDADGHDDQIVTVRQTPPSGPGLTTGYVVTIIRIPRFGKR